MTQAWYQVLSLSFGYLSCAIAAVCMALALRKVLGDRRLLRRVRRGLPRVGAAGSFKVLSAGLRRIPAGTEIRVPYEGTMGASHSCDVCIPYRKVHMRSAFFWMERDGLHMAALHRDGFLVDDTPVEPGDEAVLEDGALLQVGPVRLVLRLKEAHPACLEPTTGPYVTTARRSSAQKGRGDGLGAPGRGEMRREKKLEEKTRRRERSTGGDGRGPKAGSVYGEGQAGTARRKAEKAGGSGAEGRKKGKAAAGEKGGKAGKTEAAGKHAGNGKADQGREAGRAGARAAAKKSKG